MLSTLFDESTPFATPTSDEYLDALVFYQLIKVSSIGLGYNGTWAWGEDLASSLVWAR